ncbi:type III secretion system export apparatus subunit SctV [Pseudoalteromonas spongiae]|uniref:type III secretion system export apparatus subunit SctV n=1 Tax=Pseudoalteromonas spongiae TaxID=298657 RepID=UPI00026CDA1E|nr:type III secretion system export apparatus subunit SctV [Pseudoalteromonas spongiae]ATD01030.1 type III secretion protein V [Pseudoalteromonas spongiae UST010723-006]
MKNLLLKMSQRSDLALAVLLVAIIFMMILPLPTGLVDGLIAMNLSIAVVLLMMSVYIKSPLEFTAFPAVLLITTLFRLALSITTTRLILMDGDAGDIITTFGNFVVGGNLVVGVVIFLIITIVQFMVITKGAERVAEVSARFSLDAMPGKQMSIDGDMRAGVLDVDEARVKRNALSRESQLFGSMDGAMKFVKGDAVAGLIIIFVNILGGITIGMSQAAMSAGEALEVYSILTIGDGLISQIPALFISITAGIIVTRVSAGDEDEEDQQNLGGDIGSQVTAQPKALLIGAALLTGFALIPGFPTFIFLGFAAVIGAGGVYLIKRNQEAVQTVETLPEVLSKGSGAAATSSAESKKAAAKSKAQGDDFSITVPLLVDVSANLETALDATNLNAELAEVRRALYLDMGVPFPGVHLRFNAAMPKDEYAILMQELPVARGKLVPNKILVSEPAQQLDMLGIAYQQEQAFLPNMPSLWVDKEDLEEVIAGSLSYFSIDKVMTFHLAHVLRKYAEEFIGIQETRFLLEKLEPHYGELVKEAQRVVPIHKMSEVMQRLVSEDISIRNLRVILESLVEWGQKEKDVVQLTEYIRASQRRFICYKYAAGQNVLPAFMLDQQIEEQIRGAIRQTSTGCYLVLDPSTSQKFIANAVSTVGDLKKYQRKPVLLVAMDIRRYVRKLLESELYELPVVSFQELTKEINVQPVGKVVV